MRTAVVGGMSTSSPGTGPRMGIRGCSLEPRRKDVSLLGLLGPAWSCSGLLSELVQLLGHLTGLSIPSISAQMVTLFQQGIREPSTNRR